MSTEGNEKAKAAATKPSKLSAAIASEKASKSGDTATSNTKSADSSASNSSQPTATTTAPLSSQVGETKVEHGTTESGETVITPDPSDQSIVHPLHNRWSLYYTGPAAGKSTKANKEDAAAAWDSNVKKVMDFDTVEAFWGLFNNLQPPSHLAQKTDYHLFKDGIKPSWEDKANAKGGKWTIDYPSSRLEELNRAWTYTVLAMIGEQFEDSDEICGAVVGIRKGKSRIQLWTKTATSEQAQMRIGGSLKKFAEHSHGKIEYQAHNAEGGKFRDGGNLYQV